MSCGVTCFYFLWHPLVAKFNKLKLTTMGHFNLQLFAHNNYKIEDFKHLNLNY